MSIDAIEQLLKDRIGLHSATIGSTTVSHAVGQRMRECRITDREDYLRLLLDSSAEMSLLVDTVVIPETWFYRDDKPFSAFSAWVRQHRSAYNRQSPLRILSAPCSTGEEPYTLAMCLADLDIPVEAVQIDAIDISSRNIDRAMRACYGNNSFRNIDTAFRDRHFIRENQHYRLADTIRVRVNFSRTNILEPEFVQQRQPYQVIFCRNLLIYFDRPTQNLALDRLDQLLSPDGLLFLGHSETSLLLDRHFSPLEFPFSFGFRRTQTGRDTTNPDRPRRSTSTASPRVTRSTDLHIGNDRVAHHLPQLAPVNNGFLLSRAFRLADQGHLDEAAKHCETLLQRDCNQADVLFLLGIIRESAGNIPDAERMLRKAIYLDPDHHEALTLLSVLCLRNGDEDASHRFQRRAERARHRHNGHGANK